MALLRPVEILLVEDSPTDRLMAVEALQEAGIDHRLHTVSNGIDAMSYLRHEGRFSAAARPDVILLDLNLPRKDGREVLIEIKNDEHLRSIPVVVLTTSDAADDVAASYAHHANSYVQKPLDFARFTALVRAIGDYWCHVATLPPEDAARRTRRAAELRARAASSPGGALRVLLVEDDPVTVLLVRDLLSTSTIASFEVESVARVSELARRADLDTFHVFLTDLGLPDSQGLETYRRVRARVSGRPVIVLTGLDDETTGLDALRQGAQDYLVKGDLTASGLARAIRYAVDKRGIEDVLQRSQRLEAVGQLAAGVAHDFNNLLTVIEGQSQTLAEMTALPPDAGAAVQDIRAASGRAADLTRQLLTFSGQQVMDPRAVAVNDVVTGVTPLLRQLVEPRASLQVQLTAEVTVADVDVRMLEQVLMNLVMNAREAIAAADRDAGGQPGELTISTAVASIRAGDVTEPDAYPGRFVVLAVADTGDGIAPEVLPHIFEPFFSTKDVGRGSGLGLATVFSIVKQHRGWVRVRSEAGRGTQFEIFVPASAAPGPAAERLATVAATDDQAVGGKETILLVEDEIGVRRLASQVLTRRGYRVLDAGSGPEALALFEQHGDAIDLLFTDMVMPEGMSGQALAAALRERRPDLRVVFTSGYSSEFVGGHIALREGVNFLQKPYRPTTLLATVRAVLDSERA